MKFTFAPESKPLDGYTIKRAIHRGGFGEVYYALSDGGKEVALKLLQHEQDVELRGVQQCLNLKHPNLVATYDIRIDDDGDHWIVMEFVSGRSLADVIEEHPDGMPLEDARRWMQGMVRGLGFLHDRGIVHRDLKPANVHLDQGVVKVGDVGLSKFITHSRRDEQTQSVGTVYYMAPEVAHGRYGKEVDVYSLGIVLYEMLTGGVPFEGETAGEILMKHLSERPNLDPLPPRLRPVVARALEKDPARRTPSVEELEREFQLAVRGVEIPQDIPDESFIGHRSASQDASFGSARRSVESGAIPRSGASANDIVASGHEPSTIDHRPSPLRRSGLWHGPAGPWLRAGIVLLIALAVFRPAFVFGGARSLFVVGLYAALAYGVYRFALFLTGWGRRAHELPQEPPPRGTARSPGLPAVPAPRVQPVHHVPMKLTPETPRRIPLRQRMADLTGSMTLAVPYAALLTAAIAIVAPPLFSSTGETGPVDPGAVGLFGVVTLLGSWALLATSKLREGRPVDGLARRIGQMVAGVAVGAAAFGLDHFLLASPVVGPRGMLESLFESISVHELAHGTAPTLAGYLVFFGGLFGLRRWWRQADAFRQRRFRIGSLLLTVLLGYFLPLVFVFPNMWGVLWAATISAVVQLSAAWVPEEERGRSFLRR